MNTGKSYRSLADVTKCLYLESTRCIIKALLTPFITRVHRRQLNACHPTLDQSLLLVLYILTIIKYYQESIRGLVQSL